MRATNLKSLIKATQPTLRPLCIEGPPGGGKTSVVEQCAKELELPVIVKHLPTMLVEDFGVPDITTTPMDYKVPGWFPDAADPDTPESGILLFDDRNQADASLQKVLANITQARELHGHKLPKGWRVMSTGNRQSDRAGSNRVLSHLRDRESVVELETHLDDWCSYAMAQGCAQEVVTFIRFRPGLLHDFDPQRDVSPTPRSWLEGVSPMLPHLTSETRYEYLTGTIGEGAAAEFTGFLDIVKRLPNPDAILLNPTTSDVPTDPATCYALAGALAERATTNNLSKICAYVDRMAPEFSVLTVSMAVRQDPELTETQAFVQWSVKHQEVLF